MWIFLSNKTDRHATIYDQCSEALKRAQVPWRIRKQLDWWSFIPLDNDCWNLDACSSISVLQWVGDSADIDSRLSLLTPTCSRTTSVHTFIGRSGFTERKNWKKNVSGYRRIGWFPSGHLGASCKQLIPRHCERVWTPYFLRKYSADRDHTHSGAGVQSNV